MRSSDIQTNICKLCIEDEQVSLNLGKHEIEELFELISIIY